MGLTAFIVFVVPWVVLAVFLTRTPTALRLGAAPAPWRPIPTHRDLAREQRQTNQRNTQTADGSASATGNKHEPLAMRDGGTLGPSVEPTEPTDKIS
ncbi:hypothetical protein ACRAWG_12150 [Methylobacterium sp. P31]